MIQQVFQFVRALLALYIAVIVIRILLTWFRGINLGRGQEVLSAITDPYLNWFRRNVGIRVGALDLSAAVGVVVLFVLHRIVDGLARGSAISFSMVLALIVTSLWSIVSFVLVLFLILAGVRLIGILAGMDSAGGVWTRLEHIVNPALQWTIRPFLRGRFTTYRDSLLIFTAVLIGVLIAGRIVVNVLVQLVLLIPV